MNRIKIREDNVEAAKVFSIQNERDCQLRIQEIAVGASSSRPIDIVDLSSSSATLPKPPLSASAKTIATIDASIPSPTGTTDTKSGAHSEASQTDYVWADT